MKTLEAKAVRPKCRELKARKIDGLQRQCLRPVPWGKIESVRTHWEVIERFDSFPLLDLLFLVRILHCWLWKAFPRQMTPQSREKRPFFDIADRHEKFYGRSRLYASAQRCHETGSVLPPFKSFVWHFNEEQRAEVIFRLSRPVPRKNQENAVAKQLQWSLHALLKNLGISPKASICAHQGKETS